jgi:toxin ParE1/3/4
MPKIVISRIARNDLDDIANYIRQDNPFRAQSFIEEIVAKFRIIAERPLSFPARDDLAKGIRSALHGNYLILFEAGDDVLEIVRIIHGTRDLDNLF